ncbi:unnamed protein product [Mytilus coruscus]|uniref:Uncharacterized protein n=1 Tax=Mytilus coruscus TaxID=42192 RepID=A0A6J8AE53_MYTCO|nr:unnamed protein product [Mytilus coruscus]
MSDSESHSHQNSHPSTEGAGSRSGEYSRITTEFNAVDAVHLFNTKIDIAPEKQRISIVSELQDKLKVNSDFKDEGNKIQYSFNEERLSNLDNLANKITNKLLKIADKHGWETVREYTDSDIAENAEDATKMRAAAARAATKKQRQSQIPYTRNQTNYAQRKHGAFDGMSTRQLFLGFQAGSSLRQPFNADPRAQFNGFKPNFGQGNNVVCFYCNLPSTVLIQPSFREDSLPQQHSQTLETNNEQVEYILHILN